jgi:hypothetical protein
MHTKDDLIAAAQAVARRLGASALSIAEFRDATRIGPKRVYKQFGSWRAFCAAAGLTPRHSAPVIPDETIFRALHDAFLACGGVIAGPEVERRLPFCRNVLYRRSGSWPGALVDFAEWADKHAPAFPYRAELSERIAKQRTRARLVNAPPPSGPPWPATGARLAGEPLHDRPLQHEPINEYGVVLAFGMMAKELGYIVDSVAGAFPDCIAKRRVGERRWAPVRIEFEFKSRNFVDHGHDPKGCDVIVCWEHDWPDCPLEVLELRAAMAPAATTSRPA